MKTVLRWVLCAAATVSLITLFARYPAVSNQMVADTPSIDAARDVPSMAAEVTVIEPAPPAEKEGYYLKEYDGRLAIFQLNEDTPLHVFNVSISTMSEYDQAELHKGIFAQDIDELRLLVEDYTS